VYRCCSCVKWKNTRTAMVHLLIEFSGVKVYSTCTLIYLVKQRGADQTPGLCIGPRLAGLSLVDAFEKESVDRFPSPFRISMAQLNNLWTVWRQWKLPCPETASSPGPWGCSCCWYGNNLDAQRTRFSLGRNLKRVGVSSYLASLWDGGIRR